MSYHHGNLREALLIRAEEVIEEKGLDAVKLSALAKDLGVSHNAPSRHFKDRNGLISVLAARALDALKDFVAGAAGISSDDPIERLNTLLKHYVLHAAKRPAHFVVLTHPELPRLAGETFTKSHRDYTAFVHSFTLEAQKAGWRSDDDSDQLTLLNLSMALGLAVMGQYAVKTGFVTSEESMRNMEASIDLFIPVRQQEADHREQHQ
ncbi:TetR/AcrR family transcriptional regulator [Pseudomaricurvus alkylphenolicus]|uniref:TetR/AcrR family transcriptional regulator n=1 Tax=Pseudomaricurvus alkylphenolicus TaxID=1306991 RepID=UPI001423E3F6|nr:TetR/AcrR family transcriptional regulator [Pseudomaricurvus alkylphenolicus]NIB38029.1 TetR/AcrR family transcriptional regulator [Pseudomaricurvus alkylphenolicus]